MKKAVFCGGCFWCTEAVFKRLEGVLSVQSGYTGGFIKKPAYREVCEGRTGHAEGIIIDYDASKIDYETLLDVFFATHNPTTLNRQGYDVGTQYRSAIFYSDEVQKEVAENYIEFLNNSKVFQNPIVTTVEPLDVFYIAEEEHHDYYDQNSDQSYCQYVILPKLKTLKERFTAKLKSVQ
jgi:peptide-methionine (S)-S-oxide reductase